MLLFFFAVHSVRSSKIRMGRADVRSHGFYAMPTRTFLALDMDALILDRLAEAQRRMDDGQSKVNWVARENLHVTMNFLGDVPDEILHEGESFAAADARRTRSEIQVQHPRFGRTGLVYDFLAITDDLRNRGEAVPLNPLFPEEHAQLIKNRVQPPNQNTTSTADPPGGPS